jgi:threonine aldolase
MSLPGEFASDNAAPVHPAVMNAISAANTGASPAYGADPWTQRAEQWFAEMFGESSSTTVVWNGTGANVVALRALLKPWEAVLCTTQAHINVDECGAPERLAGCKLVDLPTADGKLTPAQVEEALVGIGDQHRVQPRVVSVTQSTEYGTVYTRDELRAISDIAHRHGLLVHMDGARIANAVAALGMSLRECTVDVGIDVLSFGATKNGAMGAEAVVVFDPALAAALPFLRKQTAQLASKMRYLGAQFIGLGQDHTWLANARQANAMARRLAEGVRTIDGVTITQSVDANAVFALLPRAATEALQRDFHFYVWDEATGEVRLMCNWATEPADVDQFVAAIRAELSR